VSNIPDVVAGVTEALAETGEPLTLRKFTTADNPADPTGPPVTTPVDYACIGYVGPVRQFNTASRVVEITTDAYIDPLSITGNTLSALTVISDLGDVLIDGSGKEWVLTREQHPRLEGRIALFWHSGLA
jgi:hypothetical protein